MDFFSEYEDIDSLLDLIAAYRKLEAENERLNALAMGLVKWLAEDFDHKRPLNCIGWGMMGFKPEHIAEYQKMIDDWRPS